MALMRINIVQFNDFVVGVAATAAAAYIDISNHMQFKNNIDCKQKTKNAQF
jgi:hypothetical protein